MDDIKLDKNTKLQETLDVLPSTLHTVTKQCEIDDDTLIRISLLGAGALLLAGGAILHEKHPIASKVSAIGGIGCIGAEIARTIVKKQKQDD
ncbi:hypothetical protein A4S06_01575 [Erysipelotrichaceae bacterium MTC7]|nr:hypothetical protein A4S06_01575 [Erysipelotrichaceae bacterium MTC7]